VRSLSRVGLDSTHLTPQRALETKTTAIKIETTRMMTSLTNSYYSWTKLSTKFDVRVVFEGLKAFCTNFY